MNKWMLVSTMALLGTLALGCAKKDDGPAPAGGCPANHMGTATGCMAVGQCPQGLVVSSTNAAMCADPNNLQRIVTTQQCTAGQILTKIGCLSECEDQPGHGSWAYGVCIKGVSGSMYGSYSNTYNSQGQYMPAYGQYPGYGQFGGYNPYYGGGYYRW